MPEPYDPVKVLCEQVRKLAQIWADWGMDFHPAYARALAEADKAERWMDDPEQVEAA